MSRLLIVFSLIVNESIHVFCLTIEIASEGIVESYWVAQVLRSIVEPA